MFLTPPILCRQPAFIRQLINNEVEELNVDEINENLGELQTLDLNETVYRGINIFKKASSFSNLEELNKIPLIKKFNSF
jgi:hypothetical protein